MAAGHVYILVNASMPGLLKIGMTVRTPEERAAEVSRGTGVPSPFMVGYAEEVPDCFEAERLIHRRLDRFRTRRNREFFQLPLRDAISELAQIAQEVRRSTSVASQPPPSLAAPRTAASPVATADETPAAATGGAANRRATEPPATPIHASSADGSLPVAMRSTHIRPLAAVRTSPTERTVRPAGCAAVGCVAVIGCVGVPVVVPLVWFYVVVPIYNAFATWGGKFWIVLAAVLAGVGALMWGWAAVRAERRASK